jgi:hypothetical protein
MAPLFLASFTRKQSATISAEIPFSHCYALRADLASLATLRGQINSVKVHAFAATLDSCLKADAARYLGGAQKRRTNCEKSGSEWVEP